MQVVRLLLALISWPCRAGTGHARFGSCLLLLLLLLLLREACSSCSRDSAIGARCRRGVSKPMPPAFERIGLLVTAE
jgi:hypothetical protein